MNRPPVALAPSILSADFTRLGDEVRAVSAAGAEYIHVDVMDGHFVPNLTLGPAIVSAVRSVTDVPLDVHLMIEAPERSLESYVKAGASIVTVHVEACVHLHRVVQQIKELGVKAGVALNPATPLSTLDVVLEELDLVLIMTVNPGFGGQKPIPTAIRKLTALRQRCQALGLTRPPLIEVDGGVKASNVLDFAAADIMVSGSGIFEMPTPDGQSRRSMSLDALTTQYRGAMDAIRRPLQSLS